MTDDGRVLKGTNGKKSNGLWSRFTSWLNKEPIKERAAVRLVEQRKPAVIMTGPALIEHLARAFELNQSFILAGPRGCGKSYCVGAAIELAAKRGVILPGASVFLQGNREIPRDYLVEDEIAFRTTSTDQGERVTPYRRSAPLFVFADRDPTDGEPIVDRESGVVRCFMKDKKKQVPVERFVLFLDEINRFSDGVLDSLLSVLEERKAVLGGHTYKLPVVVGMTMNPPGYDGSARKLSPPLAARIGQSYRLSSPDLNILSDMIISDKIDKLALAYRMENEARPPERRGPEFPVVRTSMVRKVAVVTLCLWGDINREKAGNEYLTDDTKKLLKEIMAKDATCKRHMEKIADLCLYGPDGRAGADWMTTAIGLALEEAMQSRFRQAVLREDHLVECVVACLSHKIYDNFSAGSRPDLTAEKEQAVVEIARRVFTSRLFTDLIKRDLERMNSLAPIYQAVDRAADVPEPESHAYRQVREAFILAQVTADDEVANWVEFARDCKPLATNQSELLLKCLVEHGMAVPAEGDDKPAFTDGRYAVLARNLADMSGEFPDKVRGVLGLMGATRRDLATELSVYVAVRMIESDRFVREIVGKLGRFDARIVAEVLEAAHGMAIPERDRDKELQNLAMRELVRRTSTGERVFERPNLIEAIMAGGLLLAQAETAVDRHQLLQELFAVKLQQVRENLRLTSSHASRSETT